MEREEIITKYSMISTEKLFEMAKNDKDALVVSNAFLRTMSLAPIGFDKIKELFLTSLFTYAEIREAKKEVVFKVVEDKKSKKKNKETFKMDLMLLADKYCNNNEKRYLNKIINKL